MKTILFSFVSCALLVSLGFAYPEDLLSSRIINGAAATVNQFPWHAQITGYLRNNQTTLCGGALVSPTHVLTAAHCVISNDFEFFRVGLGAVNRTRPLVSFEVNPLDFNARVINPLYVASTFANDLALLRLPFGVTQVFAFLAPIRLQQLSQANQNLVNIIAITSGFGRLNDQSLAAAALQYARVRIILQTQCSDFYGTAVANANTLCTLGSALNAQGPCANDNGGPLVLEETTGNTLVGITSFISASGCNVGHPAGYARIGPHIQWISTTAGVATRP